MPKKVWNWVGIGCVLALFCASCLSTVESVAASLPQAPKGSTKRPVVTNAEAISALKDALKVGIQSAADRLSARDGYFGDVLVKILLPEEAKPIIDNLKKIPKGRELVDDVVLRLNRAAESAAAEAVPIFTDVIMSMTIADGIKIVKGGNRAATEYLRSRTWNSLRDLYRPKVDAALAKPLIAGVSAKKSWTTLTTAYNRAGQVANSAAALAGKKKPMPPVEVDLATYATEKALEGLFLKVGDEEEKIRKNPLGYASSMIKKVFGALKNGLL